MAKYSKSAGKEVEESMHQMKKGTLKTGTGAKVTDPKQAIAIGLSEAKEKGAKVPAKKTAKKAAAKKTTAKRSPKKASSKKTVSKKAAGKKSAKKM